LSIQRESRQKRLAEIAPAVSQGRNCRDSRLDELCFTELLEIEEEKTLAVAVVQLPNQMGPPMLNP
jgi:hypothetical protein